MLLTLTTPIDFFFLCISVFKISWPNSRSQNFLSRSLFFFLEVCSFWFPFRSMIHFELLSVVVGGMNWSVLFAYGCPNVSFVEKTTLLTELLSHLCKKSVVQGCTNLFPFHQSICSPSH